MRIAFVKSGESHDRIYVMRDDGQELGWRWPDAPMLPHDLVHFIVESRLGLQDGFWGLIAQGVDLGAVNAAGHSPGGQRLADRDTTELLQAEVLVNAVGPDLPGVSRSPSERLDQIAARCKQSSVPVPQLDDETIARLSSEVASYDERWRSLPPRGAINVEFSLRRPTRAATEDRQDRP